MPSFTNPNNVSIITGQPPSIHGIAGNYLLDPATKKEHMIQDDSLLRGSTILEQMNYRGVRVAAVTVKDKLRRILGHGLAGSGAICFSAKYAGSCSVKENGIDDVEAWVGRAQPSQYSGDLSLFVLDAGIKILEEKRADLLYLTLSDYIQHKHAPGQKESDEFLAALDQRLKDLVDLGAVVAVTGDHGMSDKCLPDGKPNVLFLEDQLASRFGKGSARIICPITDPFVRHHGALGSFVRVYLENPADHLQPMLDYVRTFPQVQIAMGGEEATSTYDLPLDREGHFVVISQKNAVIGSREEEHDLSNLGEHRLRSHGGLSEQDIPLVMSRPVRDAAAAEGRQWRNYDAFELALNW
jgi:phosphonoacetate hydrolase